MECHGLLAVDHAREIHAALGQGLDREGDHRREGRRRLQSVLVDERQFLLVQRVGAEADPQGVKHRPLVGPDEAFFVGGQLQHVRIGDGHESPPESASSERCLACARAGAA